jgi:hypothetical protein
MKRILGINLIFGRSSLLKTRRNNSFMIIAFRGGTETPLFHACLFYLPGVNCNLLSCPWLISQGEWAVALGAHFKFNKKEGEE